MLKKRILSLVMALTMTFGIASVLPKSVFTETASITASADDETSGKCGENVFWSLDDEGVLTISGNGKMYDYEYFAPYDRTGIKSVVIKNGVTRIGDIAFSDCEKLTSINIPDSVTSIGSSAFSNCENLISINIPDSVTSIGFGAFRECTNFTSVTIPSSVTSIGNYAFYNCTSLSNIIIVNSDISIGYSAFDGTKWFENQQKKDSFVVLNGILIDGKNCSGKLTIPSSIKSIGGGAFSDCTNLTSVTIPNGVTCIGNGAFSYCTSLTNVTIPRSVTRIGNEAFNNCSDLTSVTIPSGVKTIEDRVFYGCSNLTNVTIPSGITYIDNFAFGNCSSLTSITIPNGVTSIGDKAFSGCKSLTSVTIPDSVSSIGENAFEMSKWLEKQQNKNALVIINGILIDGTACKGIVDIPRTVKSICGYAFHDCNDLTSVTIPNSVTCISNYTFYRCSSLTSINIPSSVKIISRGAFLGCRSLACVTIPISVISIGKCAFYECTNLTSVIIPSSVTNIDDYAFGYFTSSFINWIDGFTIYGAKGSAAEKYANSNARFKFVVDPNCDVKTKYNEGTPVTDNKTINFTYGNYGETVRYYSFKYNDSWLLKDSQKESANMANFSANLAVAAYENDSVTSCLEQMGFDKSSIQDFGSYDFKPTYEDNDRVAFTIAYKKVNEKNIFVVPIRGTHGNCEWFSDFNLGSSDNPNHEGFYKAANRVKNALASCFANIGVKSTNTIVYFTGHSRGAAVANILAGEICTKGIKSADEKTTYKIPVKQVFAYTYACPAVSRALSSDDTALKNIFNYINPGDLIPALPLSEWGYTRYGNDQTIVFKTNNDTYYDFQHRFYDFCTTKYKGSESVKGIEATLKALVPNEEEYSSDDLQFLFKYLAIQMMKNTPESVLPCSKDELFAKLKEEYHIPFLINFNSATETATELAIYFGPLFKRINPYSLGVAFASLKDLLSVIKSDAIAHGHMGETYVKWVEAWYAKSQKITHKYKNPVVVAPRIGSDGYTLHECKKCNYIVHNNYTSYDAIYNTVRIAGNNRFDTSAQIADQCYGYAETVVLASGVDYPDALAGIPLAQAYDAPILLTAKDSISQSVLDEITSLHAKRVIILGGQGAISSKVEDILRNKGLSISRIAGSNRFDTAARVAEELNEKTKTDSVFFAYYNGFADALSVSHVAGIMGAPVLYVTKDGDLDESTKRYLDSVKGNIKNVFVIGGSGVISDNMKMKIGSYTGKIAERVSGNNRYQTCVAINRRFNNLLTGQDVLIATGKAFPDALAGGVLAAKTKSPLILADGVLSKEQEDYIKSHKTEIVCALGGIGAVPQDLLDSIVKITK